EKRINFSDTLNACLVSIDDFNPNARSVIHSTYNVYTNEELLTSTVTLQPNNENHEDDRIYFSGLTEEEYWRKHDLLMKD
ncbi:hypothetical protein KW795_02305, partial [Candidatus Microgenomates bacterium]|nr:hypothetical protein [Candidatus Microgenomates bacterium]